MSSVVEREPLRLQVLNGNGTKGSAGRWSDILENEGFEILAVGDAERSDFETTRVLVRPEGWRRVSRSSTPSVSVRFRPGRSIPKSMPSSSSDWMLTGPPRAASVPRRGLAGEQT